MTSARLTTPAVNAAEASGAAIEVSEVWQAYSGVQAVTNVSMTLAPSEVIGLVGHNGAGKSTLTRIIGGVERPASGRLLVQGKPVEFHAPQDAIAAGISIVPQALGVVPTLSVRENIALGTRLHGRLLRPRRRDGLSKVELGARIAEIAGQLGIAKELGRKTASCTPSTQRMVMIGRALVHRPAVMLLDEPTAALHPEEANRMFEAVEALRAEGMAIMFISHRLDEVLKVSSRVVVMRQGKVVADISSSGMTASQLGELIAGRELHDQRPPASVGGAHFQIEEEAVVSCDHLYIQPVVQDLSFEAVRGEVVGLAGLEGSGCTEVLRAIAGLLRPSAGSVSVRQRPLRASRRAAIKSGVAYLPDDRVHNGIAPEMTVAATVTLSNDREFRIRRWLPILSLGREALAVDGLLDTLDLHPRGASRKKIKFLSGGNQQKALMARALIAGAEVYLFDQPTEGVDVGARQELHRHIRDLASKGGTVVVTSSEPEELVGLCDRVIVMHDGRLACELVAEQISEARIVHASLVGY